MTAVLFDVDFDTLGSAEFRYAMHAIEDSNVRLGVLLQAPELSIGNLDSKLFPKAVSGRSRFVKFIRMVLAKRLASPKAHSKDIFSFLQDCTDPDTGKSLTVAELSTETATFIVAGKTSPAYLLLWPVFFYFWKTICRNPLLTLFQAPIRHRQPWPLWPTI